MRNHDLWGNAPGNNPPDLLCSLDPISLGTLALGTLGTAAYAASNSSGPSTPTPQTPPPQAAPSKTPAPKQNTQQPSFMGAIPTPPPTAGQKTLLGQ